MLHPKEVANSLRAITIIPQTFAISVVFFEREQKMKFIFGAVPRLIVIMVAGVLFSSAGAFAQQTATSKNPAPPISGSSTLSQAQIDSIISAVTIKETQFRQALNEYAFKRDALVQEIGMGGQVVGEYHRVSNFTFDDNGTRFEKINFFPMSTLQGVSITPEDLEDLGGVNPFALEAAMINRYNFKYVGKERIDELDLYVFDVTPKVMPDPKKTKDRVFVGRIWVDDRDLQIVKSKGKAGPETKTNKFPTVETWREQIDNKYWFPTYVYADDDLVFDNGQDVRIRMAVKYTDYKKGHATVIIKDIGEAPTQTVKPESKTTQPAGTPEFKTIEGGIINSRAIDLPAPKYPDEARKKHDFGEVQVRVLVDETGKVISAEAIFGPESLRAAAVEAARRARFTPASVGNEPALISGVIKYDIKPQ